jgi:coiled-coil and C2 domain-containing protein 2A
LKLSYDERLSNFAFNFNLRRYMMGKEDYLAAQLEEAFRAYKRREASGLVALYSAKSAAAGARANVLKQEMAAGAALWLERVSPADRLAALEEEAEEARRLALDEVGWCSLTL